eukprot:5814080-Prymnesium_polylepis.1
MLHCRSALLPLALVCLVAAHPPVDFSGEEVTAAATAAVSSRNDLLAINATTTIADWKIVSSQRQVSDSAHATPSAPALRWHRSVAARLWLQLLPRPRSGLRICRRLRLVRPRVAARLGPSLHLLFGSCRLHVLGGGAADERGA